MRLTDESVYRYPHDVYTFIGQGRPQAQCGWRSFPLVRRQLIKHARHLVRSDGRRDGYGIPSDSGQRIRPCAPQFVVIDLRLATAYVHIVDPRESPRHLLPVIKLEWDGVRDERKGHVGRCRIPAFRLDR